MRIDFRSDQEEFCESYRAMSRFPFVSYTNISHFISGCEIVGGMNGVHFTFVRDGRPSGEAYIELASEKDVEKAITKNNEHMGKRYIEGMLQ